MSTPVRAASPPLAVLSPPRHSVFEAREGVMNTDAVLNYVAEIERLTPVYWAADKRLDIREVNRLGERLNAIEAEERHTPPQSLAGAVAKLRRARTHAFADPPLAAALRHLARDVERHEPQRRHLRLVRACIDRAYAAVGGTGLAAEVVPRLESVLAWMLKPRLVYSAPSQVSHE
jgi:hypothetical protein